MLVLLPGVLEHNDVFLQEGLVSQEIFPVFGFDVELFDGFVRKNVASGLDTGNMGVVIEHLEQDRAMWLAIAILVYLFKI